MVQFISWYNLYWMIMTFLYDMNFFFFYVLLFLYIKLQAGCIICGCKNLNHLQWKVFFFSIFLLWIHCNIRINLFSLWTRDTFALMLYVCHLHLFQFPHHVKAFALTCTLDWFLVGFKATHFHRFHLVTNF